MTYTCSICLDDDLPLTEMITHYYCECPDPHICLACSKSIMMKNQIRFTYTCPVCMCPYTDARAIRKLNGVSNIAARNTLPFGLSLSIFLIFVIGIMAVIDSHVVEDTNDTPLEEYVRDRNSIWRPISLCNTKSELQYKLHNLMHYGEI